MWASPPTHFKKSNISKRFQEKLSATGVGKPQADSEVRANSAGRFRCGCTRSYTLRVNPSTSFAGPPRTERSPLPCGHLPTPWGVTPFRGGYITNLQTPYEIKLPTCIRKTIEYQHYRYRQGQQPALASPRRTARYERIPPDGFGVAALEVTLCG